MIDTVAVTILFGLFALLIILRVPVAFGLAISSLATLIYIDKPLLLLVERYYASLEFFPLLAIPFFILCGFLMNQGSITDRFLKLAGATVGHFRGGLAQVNVVASMMFASVSGTGSSDTAALGSVLIPAMRKEGYSAAFSAAVTACSSVMGAIIPPSVIMIVYGSLASNVSISALFLAGIVPGVLIGLLMMLVVYFLSRKRGYPRSERRATVKEWFAAFKRCLLPLGMPIIIIGGILSGTFTPTEAAVIAVVYVIVVLFILRDIRLKDLPRVMNEASKLAALPLFAIASATLYGWLIAYLRVPAVISAWLEGHNLTPVGGLFIVFVIFTIAGMFIDGVPALIIFLPIAQEIAAVAGVDPMHLAMVIIITAVMGLITPPFGLCILLAGSIAKIPVMSVVKESLPFVAVVVIVIFSIIFFPQIALWLPGALL